MLIFITFEVIETILKICSLNSPSDHKSAEGQPKHGKRNSHANERKTKPGNYADLQENVAAAVALGFLEGDRRQNLWPGF